MRGSVSLEDSQVKSIERERERERETILTPLSLSEADFFGLSGSRLQYCLLRRLQGLPIPDPQPVNPRPAAAKLAPRLSLLKAKKSPKVTLVRQRAELPAADEDEEAQGEEAEEDDGSGSGSGSGGGSGSASE